MQISHFIIFGHSPDHIHPYSDMCSVHLRARRLHLCPGSTYNTQETVLRQKPHTSTLHAHSSPCTSWAVSTDALPDNQLPLPQHSPEQVPGAAADLDHFSRGRHLHPGRTLRVVVRDSFSEPHLDVNRNSVG